MILGGNRHSVLESIKSCSGMVDLSVTEEGRPNFPESIHNGTNLASQKSLWLMGNSANEVYQSYQSSQMSEATVINDFLHTYCYRPRKPF